MDSEQRHRRQAFVPDDFDVPERLETASYRLRKLTVNDLVKTMTPSLAASRTRPFRNPGFPGADISWKEWQRLDER
jgi:hypothetical protein